MVIIDTVGFENNKHNYEQRSWEKEVWKDGWLEVPKELESVVIRSKGYGVLTVMDGALVDYTPTEIPESQTKTNTSEPVDWEAMANAITEGVNSL